MGYMVADLALMSQWSLSRNGRVENTIMFFHHALSLASWPVTIYYEFCGRYVLILLSYEFTSLFLIINWFLSSFGMKSGALYFVSGLLFTFSFVFFRMLLSAPQLMAMLWAPPWQAPQS